MKVLITGASGVAGEPLSVRCRALSVDVIRAGRTPRSSLEGWIAWNMETGLGGFDGPVECVLHAAPLWLLPRNLQYLADRGVKRVVCFSSTSLLTKSASPNEQERRLASALSEAESRIRTESSGLGVATTIFRPTMIYGYGRDKNISTIARFIRKYGFFPIAGNASGKRRPIHVDDVAEAAVSIIDMTVTFGKTYNLAGQEILTYRAMLERIFTGLRRPVRLVRLPRNVYRGVLEMVSLFSRHVTSAMAERMNQDLVFDYREAQQDFDFSPGKFLQHPDRDLLTT